MLTGALLDNCAIGQDPPDSSYRKLVAMGATTVGILWTGGTRHKRSVYERCEQLLSNPLYIARVGGHRQTPAEWLADARDALAEVPDAVLLDNRVLLVCGNEPNIETWGDDPAGYGSLYAGVMAVQPSVPVLFACPSVGLPDWRDWLWHARGTAGYVPAAIVNLYDGNVGLAGQFAAMFPSLYVGEVNRLEIPRGEWMRGAFDTLHAAGVKAALVFIAGGESGGAWDERYIIGEDEASSLAWAPTGGGDMEILTEMAGRIKALEDRVAQLLAQNAAITEAFIALREGRWTGPGSFDGQIVALRGSLPAGYKPVFPLA